MTYTAWEKLDVTLGARVDYTVKTIGRTKTSNLGPVPNVIGEREYVTVPPKLTLDYRFTRR